jgi:hypothetical protein
MGFWLAAGLLTGGALITREAFRDAARREIAAARNERDNHFVNLRESARRGGFNPLTALRATGGGGYGQYVPLLSRTAEGEGNRAMGNFVSTAMRDLAFTRLNQEHEIALNKMNNEAALKRLEANRPPVKPDLYKGYDDYIPVKVGNNIQQLDIGIAKRLNIPPNARLTQGELSELIGEISEVMNLPQNEIRDKILKPVYDGGQQIDTDDWSVQDLVNDTLDAIQNTPIGNLTRATGWTDRGVQATGEWTILKPSNPNAMKTVITRGRQYGGTAGM